ncbi:MAG TPA: hypothetical protein PLH19_09770 [Anaerolineae bacterium]|nr:hypothetical protein [Anaerolineae bacterium]HQH38806.1 hypothetical protein [Anaerolineae bacterium]
MKPRISIQWPTLDLLWPWVVWAAFGFYIALVPLPPNDFWWHLKVGELIYQTGHIPTTNMFAWSLPAETPFFYGAWLGEWLLYLLYHLGGLALVMVARNGIVLGAYAIVAAEARRRGGSWRMVALPLALACFMSMNNLILRPQMWSWMPLALYLWLLGRYVDGKLHSAWLLLCPAMMVFWVNAHGAFILGLVLLGAFTVGEGLRTGLKQTGARSWREVGWLAGVSGLTAASTFVNPRGTGIMDYVIGLMTNPPSQTLIVEWQSPTPTGGANTVFYISILILLLVLAYSRYRLTPTEALLVVGFLWLAWNGQRYVVWFGMVVMPVLAHALKELPVKRPAFVPRRNAFNLLLMVLLVLPLVLAQPWFVEQLPLPETYWAQVWRNIPAGPLLSTATPVGATAYLKAHPGGRLFNEMGYGSYLIWAAPEQPVFIDPRVELYPYEQWLDYKHIGQGVRSLELLEKYGVNRVLLDNELQEELRNVLEHAENWHCEYADEHAQMWIEVTRVVEKGIS